MKKASLFASAIVLSAIGIAPAMAQDGAFRDVPNDHWAYQALERLAKDKIVIGDPDGRYQGRRTLTRYEMAMIVDRLIRLLDERYVKAPLPDMPKPGVSMEDVQNLLNGYATKQDLAGKADRSELGAFAKQADLDMLRKMVAEFQTELTTLGVDLDNVKKKIDNHEKRIAALEDAWKRRVRVNGVFNANVRGTYTKDGSSFRDRDGYLINRGGILDDTHVMHDLDVTLKASPNDETNVDIALNFGNYLPYLNSVTNFTGNRSSRGGFGQGVRNDNGPINLDQGQTIYKAVLSYGKKLPILGDTGVMVGRIPYQQTALTFKQFDVDSYFTNSKTDEGDIPVDGVKLNFKVGPFGVQILGAKNDPIQFVSNSGDAQTNFMGTYGIAAGAANGAYAANSFGGRGSVLAPPGSRNGAMMLEQMAAARVTTNFGSVSLGGNFIAGGGTGGTNFDSVNIYGGDLSFQLGPITVGGEYSKADTRGLVTDINNVTERRNVTTKFNDAYEAWARFGKGKFNITGGYRYVAPLFGAPGYWTRLGSFVNPTDIQGPFGHLNIDLGKNLGVVLTGQSYEGTGKIASGLGKDEKMNNFGGTIKVGLGASNSLWLGGEITEYKSDSFEGDKPKETFLTATWQKILSPNSTFRLFYQAAEFKNNGSGFDATGGNVQKGAVVGSQFTVRF